MIKIIDDRMDARGKEYLVFKVYQNSGDDTVMGYLISHSQYDADDHLNFVKTDRDVPVKEGFIEAARMATAFGEDFDIGYMWIQDLDNLFPPEVRPELLPPMTDHLKEAS